MATQAEYAAGAAAAAKIISADIDADVPGWAGGMIPADMAANLGNAVAKAVIDTVDQLRAKGSTS